MRLPRDPPFLYRRHRVLRDASASRRRLNRAVYRIRGGDVEKNGAQPRTVLGASTSASSPHGPIKISGRAEGCNERMATCLGMYMGRECITLSSCLRRIHTSYGVLARALLTCSVSGPTGVVSAEGLHVPCWLLEQEPGYIGHRHRSVRVLLSLVAAELDGNRSSSRGLPKVDASKRQSPMAGGPVSARPGQRPTSHVEEQIGSGRRSPVSRDVMVMALSPECPSVLPRYTAKRVPACPGGQEISYRTRDERMEKERAAAAARTDRASPISNLFLHD